MAKPVKKSRVLWFNLLSGAVLATDHLLQTHMIPLGIATAVLIVVNSVLRLFTTQPIQEVQAKPQ